MTWFVIGVVAGGIVTCLAIYVALVKMFLKNF